MPSPRAALDHRIKCLDERIDEEIRADRKSGMIRELNRLREERDAMDRDQADTIAAVVKFAKELRDLTPERLRATAYDTRDSVVSKTTRLLERERVAAELLQLLEEAGVDIHA